MAATGTTRLSPDFDTIPFQGPFSVDITPLGFDVYEVNPPGRCQRMFHPTRLALYLHWMAVTSIYDPDLEHLSFSERPQAMITEMMSMLANGGNLLMPLDDMEAQLAESLGVPNEWDDLKHVMAEKLASDPDCMPVLEGWAPLRTRVVIPRHGCDVVYTTTDEGDGTRVHIYVPDVLRKRRRIADPIVAVCNQDPSCRSDVAEADEVGIEQEQEHNASLDDDDIKQEHDAFLDDNGIKQEHEASVDDIDSAMRDMNIGSNTESPAINDSQAGNNSQPDPADAAASQLYFHDELSIRFQQRKRSRLSEEEADREEKRARRHE